MRLLPDPGPLTPDELLALTPKESALLEAMRRLLGEVRYACDPCPMDDEGFHVLTPGNPGQHVLTVGAGSEAYLAAKGLYLKLRSPRA